MKVLLELIEDAARALENLEDVDELRPQSRRRLRELLETVSDESARLLREVDASRESSEEREHRERRNAVLERGLAALARERLEEAKSIFSRAADEFSQDVEVLNHLGLTCWERGELDEAEQWYDRAMRAGLADARQMDGSTCESLSRGYFRAVEGRALCLRKLGDDERAVSLFDALARMAPGDYAGCHYLAGEILHERDRLEEAIEAYERSPDEPAVCYNLGLAHFQSGDREEAATTLIRGFAANPHIAARLLEDRVDSLHGPGGYLGSATYAEEFVEACREMWTAHPEALEFVRDCFEHPLVRHHLQSVGAGSESSHGDATHVEPSPSETPNSEGGVVAGIARHIVERTD